MSGHFAYPDADEGARSGIGSDPLLSIVIPTLDEERSLARLLGDLSALEVPYEVIVSDGGSTDGTVAVARSRGARVLDAPRGRGTQLGAGAAAARAPVLCFLHADVRIDASAVTDLATLARTPPKRAFAFRLRIDAPGLVYRLIEAGTNLRGWVLGLPFGDQGLIVGRGEFDAAGGYPAIPLMEDVALVRALSPAPGVRLLESSVLVSPRRWERDGPLRRTLHNLALLFRYLRGEDPARLVERYRPESDA